MATMTQEISTAQQQRVAERGRSRSLWLALVEIGAVLVLWGLALRTVQPTKMTDLGLVSVLPWTWFAALFVPAASFVRVLRRDDSPLWLLAGYPLGLTALFYATPAILYELPRYSWAWKHVGIVDFIQRTGRVNPHIDTLSVYHNWPGFFAFNAMLTDLTGLHSPLSYAAWAEVFFNVLTVASVMLLLRCLVTEVRSVVVGGWLFALGNWVGQGYWSPQGMNYLWYLLVIAILVRWFPAQQMLEASVDPPRGGLDPPVPPTTSPGQRAGLMAVVLLLLGCIVSTHQLTPFATVLTLATLVVFRRTDARALPLLTAVMMAAWLLYVAAPFTYSNMNGIVDAIGAVDRNVHGTLIGYGNVSPGLKAVSLTARGLTLALCALAGLGFLASLRRGRPNWTAVMLAAVPVILIAFSPYGSEILFRAYLFALPGLVFFAALLLWPPGVVATWRRSLVFGLVSIGLMVGFGFAQYGNDRRYHFTEAEAAAADYIYDRAPLNSLLVEGSRNYPAQFENYDSFTYVPIDLEEPPERERIVNAPVRVLSEWMGDKRYNAAYVIITRSQEVETASTGGLPGGGLARVEKRLRNSPKFTRTYHNKDASVFVLARDPRPQQRFREIRLLQSKGGTR
jgi:hypothetical protein